MRFRDPRTINLTPLWVLIGVNVLVFIATSISSGSFFGVSQQIANQAGINSHTFASQPWTIVSAMFIHDGIYHILFNMISLYFFGMYVLALVGETRFFLVYFIGGIVGNALFMLLAPGKVAVGASGAIFALGGVLAVLVPRLKVMIFPVPVPMDLWIAILVIALISMLPGLYSGGLMTGVAWQAHFGGLLTGIAAGYIFKRQAIHRRY